jgi:hypothetical protein
MLSYNRRYHPFYRQTMIDPSYYDFKDSNTVCTKCRDRWRRWGHCQKEYRKTRGRYLVSFDLARIITEYAVGAWRPVMEIVWILNSHYTLTNILFIPFSLYMTATILRSYDSMGLSSSVCKIHAIIQSQIPSFLQTDDDRPKLSYDRRHHPFYRQTMTDPFFDLFKFHQELSQFQ